MTENELVIALDVGGTSVKSGVIASSGQVFDASETPIESQSSADLIFETFGAIIHHHLSQMPDGRIAGVAFAFPGPFDYLNGISQIRGLAKYEAIYGLNVADALRLRLGRPDLPMRFRNDAEAAIVGEALYGAGVGYRRLIGITLGTGFGSAFLVNGVPVIAGQGVPPNGWFNPLPYHDGLADDWFSIRGFTRRLRQQHVNVENLAAAAHLAYQGHAVIAQVYVEMGSELGAFLQPFVTAFEAEAVIVLGGIARAFDLFQPAMNQQLSVATLSGTLDIKAALLGAAQLFQHPS